MIPEGKTVIYVTREIERALGMEPSGHYRIVSNKNPYGDKIKEKYPDFVTLIDSPKGELLGTTELLAHLETAKLAGPDTYFLVFKNTARVESQIDTNHWKVLNPKSSLAERVENKLSQVRWLGELGTKYLPPHASKLAKLITWKNEPFIIQWAHGHTGDGTMLIKTREDLAAIQEKFAERMARLSTYIHGPSFTVNVVATANRIMMGNVSYQITGLEPFTDNSFSTVGNDWSLASRMFSAQDHEAIRNIVRDIGTKLQAEGWKGLFGVDLIKDEKNGKIYLIEVNARQPASTTFESALQETARQKGLRGLTTFEAHIRALLGLPIDQDLIAINDGAQIVQRVTKSVQGLFDEAATSLASAGYDTVIYQNSLPNSDLLRVQSHSGIMSDHGILGPKGMEIVETIKRSHFKIEI